MHVAHITNQEHVIKKKSLDLINHWHILQCNVQKRSKEIGCHGGCHFQESTARLFPTESLSG